MHKVIIEKWWNDNTKVFSIINYRKPWRAIGNEPRLSISENGGRRKNGNNCFDLQIIIGYLVINYCNYNLQKKRMFNKQGENKKMANRTWYWYIWDEDNYLIEKLPCRKYSERKVRKWCESRVCIQSGHTLRYQRVCNLQKN